MSFFFQKKMSPVQIVSPLAELAYQHQCKACPLDKLQTKPLKMKASGHPNPLLYILGTIPSFEDEEKKFPFMDERGFFIRRFLGKFFYDLYYSEEWTSNQQQQFNDPNSGLQFQSKVRFNYCLRCAKDENPTDHELSCCKKFLEDDIELTKPKIILGFGDVPLKWMLKINGISEWRGRKIPVKIKNHSCWYFPFLNVEPIIEKIKKSKFPGFKDEWERLLEFDFKKVVEFLNTKEVDQPVVESPTLYSKNININFGKTASDLAQIKEWLARVKTFDKIAIDIETNSKLRPYCADPKIVSIAVGTYDEVYAFPIEHPECWNGNYNDIKAVLQDFLLNSNTKFAHNLKFELEWFLWMFGKDVLFKTKWGCTMAQAFHIDERVSKSSQSPLSLNLLCLQYYGFQLKVQSNVDTSNILKSSLRDILIYNGMDVKYTYGIEEKQAPRLGRSFNFIYDHTIDTSRTLAITQNKGIPVNLSKVSEISFKLGSEIKEIQTQINEQLEVKQFQKRGESFNSDSPDHLVIVFRDILRLESVKKTKKDNFSTDKEVLEIYANQGVKLAKLIKDYRELTKLKSTYVDSLPALAAFDSKLHSNFNHIFVSTGRLSSDDPNMQNFPIRKNSYVREVIFAPPGYQLVAADYGQIEARVIAMASKDKVFTKMIWEKYDVHMDWAIRAVKQNPQYGKAVSVEQFLNDKKLQKDYRSLIKNKLVFPWFYGASKHSVGRDLGFSDLHKDNLFEEFWRVFEGIKKWQDNLIAFYDRNGYVETLTGRRRHAPLTRNEIINSPIQGTSSDIVVNAMNRLSKMAYEQNQPHLHPILNIHDDLTFLLPNKTIEQDVEVIAKVMCSPLFDFINVPISIEMKFGQNWYEMKELGTFTSTQFQ